MTQTEVVPLYVERGRVAIKENKSLEEIAEAVLDETPVTITDVVVPFPALPKPLELTDEHKKALRSLAKVFGQVQKTERGTLTPEEIAAVYEEREVLRTITELLSGREDAIKEYVRHHFDVDAEERGVAVPKAVIDRATGTVIVEPSPRSKDGHYVLGTKGNPERLPIPGTNMEWSREFRADKPQVEGSRLKELFEAGEISKEEYYAFTREQRVFDADKARESLKKNPALLGVLRRISTRTGVGSSLFVRKAQ